MQLTLFSAVALVSAALLTAQLSSASRDPPAILFHDLKTKKLITALNLPLSYNNGTTVGISLRQPPPEPVVVAWEPAPANHGETLFPGNQKCTAVFTPKNWNVPQSVTLANSMVASLDHNVLNAPVNFRIFAHVCRHQIQDNLVPLRVIRQGIITQCSISTHIQGSTEGINVRAFGEVPYYFMGQESLYAAYYILRSDSVAIITELQRCKRVRTGGSACMARLAIVVDGSTILVDPSNIMSSRFSASKPMSMSVSPNALPAGISMTEFKSDTRMERFTLKLRTGLSVSFTVVGGDQPSINNLLVRPDLELSQRGVTNGWCGAFDVNLPHQKPVQVFRAGSASYDSKQLVRAQPSPRERPVPAGPPLTDFLESTRVPAELNPFSLTYVQPMMVPMGPGLPLTERCPAVKREDYSCKTTSWLRKEIGFVQAGLPSYSQSSVVEAESMFAAGSAHDGLDGADSDLAAGEENGADEALFSVEGGSSVSDGFSDAVDQFWDEFAGSDEY